MPNKRIRDLDDGSSVVAATDVVEVDRAGLTETQRVTLAQAVTASGVVASAISTHEGAADPHPTYLTAAEGDAAYDAVGAAASAQAAAVQRANHTGTQAASTITDFSTAADARIAAASVDDIADVTVTTPSVGQVLKWNGSAWVNDTDSAGGAVSYKTTGVLGGYSYPSGAFFRLVENPGNASSATADAAIASKSYFMPFFVGNAVTIDDLGVEVASAVAASTAKIALYASDGTNNGPGTVIGSVSFDSSSTGYQQVALASTVTLAQGTLYWVGYNKSDGSISLRSFLAASTIAVVSPGASLQQDGATGMTISSDAHASFPGASVSSAPSFELVGSFPYIVAKVE